MAAAFTRSVFSTFGKILYRDISVKISLRELLAFKAPVKPNRTRTKGHSLWTRARNGGLTVPPLLALSLWSSSSSSNANPETIKTPPVSREDLVIQQADRLYDNGTTEELYNLLLKEKDSKNAELLWRLARAARVMAQKSSKAEEKKRLTYESLEHAKLALQLDDTNFACHKWYAIALSNVGDFEGPTIKIQNSYTMRDHFQKAIELNPTDATSRHLLGIWCFTFADMPWYQRKIAATIFSSPPTSTYEEALGHFEKAESLDPNFYSKNHVMLGKTYLRMQNKEIAKKWLEKAANENPCKSADDEEAKREAQDLLRRL